MELRMHLEIYKVKIVPNDKNTLNLDKITH